MRSKSRIIKLEQLKRKKDQSGRRNFIKTTTLGAGLLGTLSSFGLIKHSDEFSLKESSDLHLNMAGYDYARVKPIFDKKVTIEGCSFDIVKAGIGDMNTNTFNGPQSYDVTEIGIVPFILAYANENFRDYTLLPIFPLRMFRHKSVFVRTDGKIKKPSDLKGKKVGTTGYSSSSLTWIRGMFEDEYGVSPKDIEWVISNKDSSADVSGKASAQEKFVPDGVNINYGAAGKDESDLLLSGDIDALFHAAQPKAFIQGDPKISRLFKDSRQVEQDYFNKTGIFPIMHAIAVKKEVLKENPWLAESLFNAYSASKTMDFNFMTKLGWAYDTLPWYGQEFEDTKKAMGENFWPYGIDANRKTLDTICKYCYQQGFIKQKVTVEDLFHKDSFGFSE